MAYNPSLVPTVATIAALRTLPASQYAGVFVEGYRAPGDGGGGHFIATNSAVIDNGITLFASSVSGGFLRDTSQEVPTPAMAGAYADFKQISGNITVSGTALTVPGGTFSSADVGKNIYIPGAGASSSIFQATIVAGAGTSVTLSAPAPTALVATPETVSYGHDDTAALNNYFSLLQTLQLVGVDTPGRSNQYLVTNLVYGDNRSNGAESGAGWGFCGNNYSTTFFAAPNTTGVIFSAKSVAQNTFARFNINPNGSFAIGMDTSWPLNPQDSQGNFYHRVNVLGPISRQGFTGTVTAGSTIITGLSINPVAAGFARGMVLLGNLANVPVGAYVDSFTTTTITMLRPALANGTISFVVTPPGWFAENNNDTTFDNCSTNGGSGDNRDVGFLIPAQGGSVWMDRCFWFSSICYMAAQNYSMRLCEGFGVAYMPGFGGTNVGLIEQCQINGSGIYNCTFMLGSPGSETLMIIGGYCETGGAGTAMFGSTTAGNFNFVSAEGVHWISQAGGNMLSTAAGTAVTGASTFPTAIEHRKCSFTGFSGSTPNDADFTVNQYSLSETIIGGAIGSRTITGASTIPISPKFVISAVYHVHGFDNAGGAQYSAIVMAIASPATVVLVSEIPIPGLTIHYSVSSGVLVAGLTSAGNVIVQVDRISGR